MVSSSGRVAGVGLGSGPGRNTGRIAGSCDGCEMTATFCGRGRSRAPIADLHREETFVPPIPATKTVRKALVHDHTGAKSISDHDRKLFRTAGARQGGDVTCD